MSENESNLPVTPSRKAISRIADRTPTYEDADSTPESKNKLRTLKRKASESHEQRSESQLASSFLNWRVRCIEHDIEVLHAEQEVIEEASDQYIQSKGKNREQLLDESKSEQTELLKEKATIIAQKEFLIEDIQDSNISATETAYVEVLYEAWKTAGQIKGKPFAKQPRLHRADFKRTVLSFLQSAKGNETQEYLFCNIMGYWLPKGWAKCAHIVPFSFDNIQLGYLFGTEEAALKDPRNGLILQSKIEEGFDRGTITIVPISITPNPVQFKTVVLDPSMLNKTFFTDDLNITDHRNWVWKVLPSHPVILDVQRHADIGIRTSMIGR